ncbi:WG repeat-containing protein [Ferruginibacter sp. SUN106]|uniref:WG repeat-containing protein n=1 Tax=Ferruginibacter sp. SUN106 TaxID=2978348 RepID=UPI003D3680A8
MKYILFFMLLGAGSSAMAQQILIPYRVGNLYGLSNEDGKMIVAPEYDYLEWLQEGWFRTGKKVVLNDTIETSPKHFFIRNETITVTGLIHQGKVILKDEPYRNYEIILDRCIVAKSDERSRSYTKEQFKRLQTKERFYSLFDINGNNVFPADFTRIEKMDTTGKSSLRKNRARYILFMANHFEKTKTVFVFDMDKQIISDWLVKDAYTIKPFLPDNAQNGIAFEITDRNAVVSTKLISHSSGKFIISAPDVGNSSGKHKRYGNGNESDVVPERVIESYSTFNGDETKVPDIDPPLPVKERTFPVVTRHQLIKDSVYYFVESTKSKVMVLPADAKVFFQNQHSNIQYGPLMFKQEKFGLIKDGEFGPAIYDSLIYFGQKFIAWQTVNGKSQSGVIEPDGKVFIPLIYDSICAGIRFLDTKNMSMTTTTDDYRFVFREADSKYNYNKPYPYSRQHDAMLTVYQNGKCGVISMLGQTLIPIEYEMVARNNIQSSHPREDEFIILKKNGRYGIGDFSYNRNLKTNEFQQIITPVFLFTPCFYYPDYYNYKGYKLIGLYDDHFKFKGYSNEKGRYYFLDKNTAL